MVPYKLLLLLSEDEPVKHAPMRFTPGGCCPCGVSDSDVLIWTIQSGGNTYTFLTAVLEALDLVVHDQTTWTGDLNDYRLVLWPLQSTDEPEWWPQIEANEWTGRLVIGGSSAFSNAAINAYVNSLSPTTGVGLNADSAGVGFGVQNAGPQADDLTAGVDTLRYNGSVASTSGGTNLFRSQENGSGTVIWMARNKPTDWLAEFVLAGGYNWMEDVTFGGSNNGPFVENLWTVPT